MNKKWFGLLFAAYMLLLLKLTVFRTGYSLIGGTWNLVPAADLIQLYQHSKWCFFYLFGGNIIWFVPFGFLLRVHTARARAAAMPERFAAPVE